MGNSSSQPGGSSRPDGFTPLNDSVWQLYPPERELPTPPEVEVIFFHGLQLSDYREAFWRTWQSRDDSVVWPKEWLGPELKNARISSVSYDSSARQGGCNGVSDMFQIIENLLQDIVLSRTFSIGQNSKVILVGHSMGGLIIKQLLLKCLEEISRLEPSDQGDANKKERIETFLRNCRGIFYYSTPHGGSELAAYADRANHIPGAKFNMEIINFLKILSKETARINNDFSRVRKRKLNVATGAMGELYDTKFAGLSKRVVPEASARYDVDQYYSARANHFEVCKAENNSFSNIFTSLVDFCRNYATEEALSLPDLGLPDAPTHAPRSLATASSHAPSRAVPEAPLPASPARNVNPRT